MRCTKLISATILVTASLPALAQTPNRCLNPQQFGERRACAEAEKGVEALARYIQRTRHVHGLYIMDFAAPERRAAAVAESPAARPQATHPADRSLSVAQTK